MDRRTTTSGEIKVYNPANIAQTFEVEDTLDDGTPVTVSCPKYTADPLETVTCTYEAFPKDASAKLNTVTITFAGNTSKTATADVKWHKNLTGSDSGNLTSSSISAPLRLSTPSPPTAPTSAGRSHPACASPSTRSRSAPPAYRASS